MVPSCAKLESLSCELCQLGKHVRSSFKSRDKGQIESSPFSLIHSNIWGPSCVTTSSGLRYFVTFIDGFSCCTWLFLMKEWSGLFSIFSSFLLKFKLNLAKLLRFYTVIMPKNISQLFFVIYDISWHFASIYLSSYIPTKWSCGKKE